MPHEQLFTTKDLLSDSLQCEKHLESSYNIAATEANSDAQSADIAQAQQKFLSGSTTSQMMVKKEASRLLFYRSVYLHRFFISAICRPAPFLKSKPPTL